MEPTWNGFTGREIDQEDGIVGEIQVVAVAFQDIAQLEGSVESDVYGAKGGKARLLSLTWDCNPLAKLDTFRFPNSCQ